MVYGQRLLQTLQCVVLCCFACTTGSCRWCGVDWCWGKLVGTVVHFVLRVRMFVIPMFVTVSSVAVNQALNLLL